MDRRESAKGTKAILHSSKNDNLEKYIKITSNLLLYLRQFATIFGVENFIFHLISNKSYLIISWDTNIIQIQS